MIEVSGFSMVVSVISNIAAVLICYYFFSKLFKEKQKGKLYKYSILFFVTFVFAGILLIFKQSTAFIFLSLSVFMLIGLLLFEGNLTKRMLIALFYVAIGAFIEIFVSVIIISIVSVKLDELYQYPAYYNLVVILSKVILFLFINIIIYIYKKEFKLLPLVKLIAMFSIPAFSIVRCFNLYAMVINDEIGEIQAALTVCALLYVNIVNFTVMKIIDFESEKSVRYQNENIQLELQQKYYQEILDKNYEVRGLWHDMNNHVITLQYLVKNHACDEIDEYLFQLHDVLKNAADLNLSGNNVVDAMLNYKIKLAKNKNINFVHYIAIPANLKINSIDLSIVLGNIIDNAIEGCLRDSRIDSEKSIKFNMYYKKESLLIDVENTMDKKTIKKTGNKLISSKISKHNISGYGISNVKQILNKYEGNMVTQVLDDQFKCIILIPLDQKTE